MKSIAILEHVSENKGSSHSEIKGDFDLAVSLPESWSGIKLFCNFEKDDVYYIEAEVSAENNNSLLEIMLVSPTGEFKINSFILNAKTIQTVNALFTSIQDAKHIAFRMSTFGGFSTGKIGVKNIRISSLFPVRDSKDLKEKINLLGPWFHQLSLNGIKTRDVFKTNSPSCGKFDESYTEQDYNDNPLWIWSKFKDHLPQKLDGKNILDIACNCGFYSFELAKRGSNVIGIDNSYLDITRANFAKKILGVKNVEFRVANVYELKEEFKSKFDMVLCLGLLYHLEDPETVIKDVSEITDYAIFETIASGENTCRLISDKSITSDGYMPTIIWLETAFKKAGFTEIKLLTPEHFGRRVFICRKD